MRNDVTDAPGLGTFRRIGSLYGDTKLKELDLEDWSTVALVALGKQVLSILKARSDREKQRDKSLETLIGGVTKCK